MAVINGYLFDEETMDRLRTIVLDRLYLDQAILGDERIALADSMKDILDKAEKVAGNVDLEKERAERMGADVSQILGYDNEPKKDLAAVLRDRIEARKLAAKN